MTMAEALGFFTVLCLALMRWVTGSGVAMVGPAGDRATEAAAGPAAASTNVDVEQAASTCTLSLVTIGLVCAAVAAISGALKLEVVRNK